MVIIYKEIINKNNMDNWDLVPNKKLVLMHSINIEMFYFKIKEHHLFIRNCLFKDRNIFDDIGRFEYSVCIDDNILVFIFSKCYFIRKS